MLDAAREDDAVARAGLDQVEAALERDLAVEHVVDLVLPGVDSTGGSAPAGTYASAIE